MFRDILHERTASKQPKFSGDRPPGYPAVLIWGKAVRSMTLVRRCCIPLGVSSTLQQQLCSSALFRCGTGRVYMFFLSQPELQPALQWLMDNPNWQPGK